MSCEECGRLKLEVERLEKVDEERLIDFTKLAREVERLEAKDNEWRHNYGETSRALNCSRIERETIWIPLLEAAEKNAHMHVDSEPGDEPFPCGLCERIRAARESVKP